jgi:desumoylating isopeptidase 1
LESFIDASTDAQGAKARKIISTSLVPWLDSYNNSFPKPPIRDDLDQWRTVSLSLANSLDLDKLFPLIDFWRLILLEGRVYSLLAQNLEPFEIFLSKVKSSLEAPSIGTSNPRNSYVTLLRLLSNVFASSEIAQQLLGPQLRQLMLSVIVPCLLHSDSAVRSAAPGVAFNSAAYYQAARVKYYRDRKRGEPIPESIGSEEWELEMIPALLEAVRQETQSEEVGERHYFLPPWSTR